jgi:molybdate transport system substrate-binding protein
MSLEPGRSQPITGISSMATRQVLAELAEAYERQAGQRVAIESVGGVDAARRVESGEAFDFVVLASNAIEKLAAAGRVDAASRVDVARSGVAIAVQTGAARPDIATESALREALLAARTIGYSTGPSGTHLMRLFERWGIAATIAPRIVQAPPGVPVGTLVACGDVALGFQQLSELMHVPGIDVIGELPPEIQVVTVFSAAVCTASKRPETARSLLSFLASPEADAAKRRHGMDPARA